MINDSIDAQILSREQWTLELLAHETCTPIAKVQAAFLSEYKRLRKSGCPATPRHLPICERPREILLALAGTQ
jgi:hypothetical protein